MEADNQTTSEPVEEVVTKSTDDEIQALQEHCAELEHKYKLALADYQNLVRQTATDRRNTILYANEALVLDLLPVYDNLKLSVKHSGGQGNESWLTGVTHVIQQFKKVLEEAGIQEIITTGKPFDPITMEAVENRDTTDVSQENLVAEELKGGYLLNEKVITPARVAVYKHTN